MSDINKAVNKLILVAQLQKEIDKLLEVARENITIEQIQNPEYVEVNIDQIQAAIKPANYVGHVLIFKDVEINLHTDGDDKKISKSIFKKLTNLVK